MKLPSPFSALLDANVLYPAPLRDFLLQLAAVGLFEPKWTNQIQNEWIENLLLKRPDIKRKSLEKTQEAMDGAFPEATISEYENLINEIHLPDPNDRHVLAAAISAKVSFIVTFNTKDFPRLYLEEHGTIPVHPESFISILFHLDKQQCLVAFNNQVESLKNPPKTRSEVISYLQKCGIKNIADLLG
jgi:predicted nucleic acid-binding protein